MFIFALPGVIALVLFPGREAKTTFVTLLNELLPTGIRGIVLAALLAALIGSNLSVMNSVSTLVVRDFPLHFRPKSSEKAQVFFGRIAIVFCYGARYCRRIPRPDYSGRSPSASPCRSLPPSYSAS